MKKNFLVIIALFLVACQRYKYPFQAQIPDTPDIVEGHRLFDLHCNKCHPEGEAGLGPSIYALPSVEKKYQVRHGIGVMPIFMECEISDEQLTKIILYLKALKVDS